MSKGPAVNKRCERLEQRMLEVSRRFGFNVFVLQGTLPIQGLSFLRLLRTFVETTAGSGGKDPDVGRILSDRM